MTRAGGSAENSITETGRGIQIANNYGDRTHCKNGHEFNPENTRYRKDGGRVCRECKRLDKERYRKDPIKRERILLADRLRRQGYRGSIEEGMAKKDDDKATAPWNSLKPREAAMPLWIQFQKYMDENRTPCHEKPDLYSDYDDPRYPEEKTGRPFPSTGQAEALCADCPVRDLCLAYALKQKEDSGVWGGKRIVAGRVYTGSTKKEAGK